MQHSLRIFPMKDKIPKKLESRPSLEHSPSKEGDTQVKLSKRSRKEPNLSKDFIT